MHLREFKRSAVAAAMHMFPVGELPCSGPFTVPTLKSWKNKIVLERIKYPGTGTSITLVDIFPVIRIR